MMKINLKTIPYQQLATLIENQNTGTATQLAKQIGVSRSTLFNMLDEIRGAGVKIEYCETKNSYIYTNGKRLKVNQPVEIIE
ncbi:HTH domain-containing protein [Carboxylicivirga caseinilyticus]|uniref:HTH domain-containing protein n=1 Tax=Carboxylicivirga caseinilyticus TaxID=3417572 RepID=UPI003D358183|nr:HTH domain-containing protein [Marinilabiliaceae bacterium A049]